MVTPPLPKDPYLPVDAQARGLAQSLMNAARHAAIAVSDPIDPALPFCARVAFGLDREACAISFVSALAHHTQALRRNPICCLLIGEPADKGDPLTHPRLSLQARADFVARDSTAHSALAEDWLHLHPKAKLYLDFTDFSFVRFHPVSGYLNAGFGRAYRLSASDFEPTKAGEV